MSKPTPDEPRRPLPADIQAELDAWIKAKAAEGPAKPPARVIALLTGRRVTRRSVG